MLQLQQILPRAELSAGAAMCEFVATERPAGCLSIGEAQ
jgi:hypothetical protein